MKLLVCGGRYFSDANSLQRVLDLLHSANPIHAVISGAAPGADSLAHRWAQDHHIKSERYPALWGLYKRAAGPIRNAQMIKEGQPDAVVAFPGQAGTKDMVAKALAAGLPVWEVDDEDKEHQVHYASEK